MSVYDINSQADLNAAIAAIAGRASTDVFNFKTNLTLTGNISAMLLTAGENLTINGNGYTINGADTYSGFFIQNANVAINELTFSHTTARGGAGGLQANSNGSGGGAGLGGGLFVGAGANVTISDVNFTGDRAIGGTGGAYYNATGGGGLLNGFIDIGSFGKGGNGLPHSVSQTHYSETDGGFGGGGGGVSNYLAGPYATGGYGGWGAGGGGTASASDGYSESGGGGGLGAGGAIFVDTAGSLTIAGGTISGGVAQGGAGGPGYFHGNGGGGGAGFGSGIFLHGATVTFTPGAGHTTSIQDVIQDGNGNGGLIMKGAGTLELKAGNSFAGGLAVYDGVLSLADTLAAGSGAINFAGHGALQLASGINIANTLKNFGTSDTINLTGFGAATGVSFNTSTNVLTVSRAAGGSETLQLDTAHNYTGNHFVATTDVNGNTTVGIANLLTDGDFQLVDTTDTGAGVTVEHTNGNYTGTAPTGWTGGTGFGTQGMTAASSTAFAGSNVGYLNTGATGTQTVVNPISYDSYTLTFDLGSRLDNGNGTTGTVSVYAGGTLIATQAYDTSSTNQAHGAATHYTFGMALDATTRGQDVTVTFSNTGAGQLLVDNVVLTGIDTTAPTVTIGLDNDTGTAADLLTKDPALKGTGDANTVVHFTVDGSLIAGTTTSDSSGNWTFTPTGLSDGSHTIVASQTDAGDNTGTASVTFTLDTTAPTVTAALANDTGAADTITSDATISGTASANAVVHFTVDGAGTAQTTADGTGAWTFAPTGLADGDHTIVASETDTAGNTGTASVDFTLDTAQPAVTISSSATQIHADGTATITFTFSEDPGASFAWDGATGDVTVTGGVLSAISGSGLTRTATFQLTSASAGISVADGSYTDLAHNGGTGNTLSLNVLNDNSIGGTAFDDQNGNGLNDDSTGVNGITVTLTGTDWVGNTVNLSTTTDSAGHYTFDGLAVGTYSVAFAAGSHIFSAVNAGASGGTGGFSGDTGTISDIVLPSGTSTTLSDLDAGMAQPASLGDFVFDDTNLNGRQDAGEAGIAGVTVELLDQNGDVVATTSTDASGGYSFGDLLPGAYSAHFIAPSGYAFTAKDSAAATDATDSDADTTTGRTSQQTLSEGQNNLDFDAGLVGLPVLTGLDGDAATFVEDGAPVHLDAGTAAAVADPDGTLFATSDGSYSGNLTVSITAGGTAAEDVLGFDTSGPVSLSGGVLAEGADVSVGGTVIGTIAANGDGTGGHDLIVTLNSAADDASVAALVNALTYANSNHGAPSAADRTVSVTVDGDGHTSTATTTVHVTPVNDAPQGTDATVTTLEDTTYTFSAADFGFADPSDSPAGSLLAVKIATLPGAGTLTDDGVAVTAGQFISIADITGGKLQFTPVTDANGSGHADFTFQVQDDGGTANGGADLDPAPRTMTVDVTPVNDAPQGADTTVTTLEDTAYTFGAADFGFTDPADNSADSLFAVKITTLPSEGMLTLNGVAVTAGEFISSADIDSGLLEFTPAADANGSGYASFTFQVQDDGGTTNGGIDLDPVANTITFDVTPVNDAPRIFLQPSLDVVGAMYLNDGVDIVIGDGNGGGLVALPEVTGAGPDDVVLADFDGDGDLDIATANFIDGTVSVFQVDDCGCIDEASGSPISVAGQATALVAGDFNADGKTDLLVATEGTGLTELLGNGDGSFAVGTLIPAPAAYDVAVADIDGDGVLDAVTGGRSGTALEIFHSGGGAAFSVAGSAQVNSGAPIGIALDDVNGDGHADIVTANGNGTASILLGAGDGTFGVATDLAVGSSDVYLALGDLDGDGDVDIVVSNQGSNTVGVLVNQGGGAFAPQVVYAVGANPNGVALGDMDGDGHLDIVVGNAIDQTYSVLLGAGDGTFTAGDTIAATGSAAGIALGNIDAMVEDQNPIVRTFTEGEALTLAPHLVLRDDDGPGVAGAKVFISGGLTGDVLAATTTGTTIQASYDAGNFTLTLTGTAADTLADYQQVLRTVTFSSGDNPDDYGSQPGRVIGMTVDDGALDGVTDPPATIFMGVVAVDDQSTAVNDMFFTDENTIVTGHNVFDANSTTPDSDPDSTLAVAMVNGSAGDVGTQITLASGALLTLNADGTFDYDPNGAFRYLPGPLSGASNHVVTDSFTYALADGSSATVTVAVSGIDTGGDILQGTAGADTLDGGIGNDTMYGGAGDDTYVVNAAGDIVDESVGGAGTDRIRSSLSWSLASSNVRGAVEDLQLTGTGDFKATGNNLANHLFGNSGNNGLDGGAGLDTLEGGLGDDTYYLGSGSDVVIDTGGYDTISSSVSRSLAGYAGVERLVLENGAGAIAGTGNDLDNRIYGNTNDNVLRGGLGNDVLVGGLGNDTYILEDGHDAVVEAASAENNYDTISTIISRSLADYVGVERLVLEGTANINGVGNAGNNAIYGNAGNNIIDGGDGGDYLVGGLGRDELTGGGSSDRFVFTKVADSGLTAATRDLITDFAQGLDHIDLSAIDATGVPGSAFTFIADAAFHHLAGELRYFQADYAQNSRDVTIVEGDTNGDGVADFQIGVAGLLHLAATDFIV